MLADWVSNPGPLTYESGALPTALRGPAKKNRPAFSAIYLFILFTVVKCLSLCGCFPDSWPEKSVGHCIIFYHA